MALYILYIHVENSMNEGNEVSYTSTLMTDDPKSPV